MRKVIYIGLLLASLWPSSVLGQPTETLAFSPDIPILSTVFCSDRLEMTSANKVRHVTFISPKSFAETVAIYKGAVNKNGWKVINTLDKGDLVFYYAVRENYTPGISVEHFVVLIKDTDEPVNHPCPQGRKVFVGISYLISLDAPNIVSLTPDSTVLVGEPLTLTAEATGHEPLTYEWFTNNQKMAGGKSYPVATSQAHTAKSYQVKITDKNGKSTTREVRIAVSPTPIVVFVPGIAGSKLVDQDTGEELWPAPLKWERKNRLRMVKGQSLGRISATEVISSVLRKDFYGKIFAELSKTNFQEFGKNSTSPPTLFPFPYDWRLSNIENAQKLKDFVQNTVHGLYPNSRINIIGHSMGSLLARRYILENQASHSVNRLITVGTPWLGTPKVLDVVFTGRFIPEFWGLAQEAIVSPDKLKQLAATFPAVHELLPGPLYHDLGGIAFGEDGFDFNRDGQINHAYSYYDLITMLDRQFQPESPGAQNIYFLGTSGQENGRVNPAGVEYFHILGKNTKDKTITKLVTRKLVSLGSNSPFGIRLPAVAFAYFAREFGDGDGTVALASARRQGFNLSEDNRHILVITGQTDEAGHSDMIGNNKVIASLVSLLKTGQLASLETPDEITSEQDGLPEQPTTLQLFGISQVEIISETGTRWNPYQEPSGSNMPFEGFAVDNLGEEVVEIRSTTSRYSLGFAASGKPLTVLVTEGQADSPTATTKYLDLALPQGSKIRVEVADHKLVDMRADGNNDGQFETVVTPSVQVAGSQTQDTSPPKIAIFYRQVKEGIRVTITATDQGDSGVARVYYSVGSTAFNDYAGPFVIPIRRIMPIISTFADDNIGNRSSLLSVKPKVRRRR